MIYYWQDMWWPKCKRYQKEEKIKGKMKKSRICWFYISVDF